MFSAAILNGGQATRLGGQDKGALVVDGRTIRARQIDELSRITSDILLVGAARAAGAIDAGDRHADQVAPRTFSDRIPGCGPLGGLHTALTEARGVAVFVLACDMPYIDASFAEYLLELTRDADIVVPRTERGYHPLCAAYTPACLASIERRLSERHLKMTDLFADVRTRVVTSEAIDRFGDRNRLLANVNTQAEYAGIQDHKL